MSHRTCLLYFSSIQEGKIHHIYGHDAVSAAQGKCHVASHVRIMYQTQKRDAGEAALFPVSGAHGRCPEYSKSVRILG